MWCHLPWRGDINSKNIWDVVAALSLQLNLTTTTNSNEPWRIPSCRASKSTSNWSGGTQRKMYELPWWCAVISIISDDGFTLSQIIFLSSPVNQYSLQISNTLSFIPDQSKYKLNIYCFEKLPTNGRYRSMLCKDLFDHRHQDLCRNDCFHIQCDECECKYCNQLCTHYHERFCPEMT